ncbi:potassium transporter [Methanobrevibacter arboriphilus JCM 13429 = DSM 1125]|uniref:Potassium transporter n=1 Tax=Methanobrevibacter arboriphilus JCM 13429 = DSM 1125 TaxID=1300164 RepID=A0A1V6N540_METAZ|nr:TrkH family potassium uptake protein [Methanobrevibacter arboriphilus]OQD59779.1 potassium transporter [Methanobrevibacter arboriphilus JCM 13429 = DSM 1125]
MKYITRRDIYIALYYLGKVMQGVGIVILLPIIIALIYREHIYLLGFIIPSLISLGVGTLLGRINPKCNRVRLKHGMIVSSLAWLWAAFIGALVMYICLDISFINAFFENMSAWTGSGFTIFQDVEILPNSILFLRSLEQWVGGLGVVVIMIGVLIHSGTAASRLYKSEAREDRIKPSIANTLKKILQIYLIYTIIGTLLFIIVGMPVFDAVNNTFTAISTGGMSIKNINMGFYNNDLFYIISMIMMIIGATSFLSHYQAIKTRGKSIFSDIQFKAMIGVIIVASLLLILANNILPIDAIYSVVSAITTTGASINPSGYFTDYNAFIKVIIIVLMFIGGAAGSTVGAVKIIRVITLLRGIYKNIINIISPEGRVINMELSNKNLKETQVREASSYISLYLIFIVIGWSVLVFYGYDGMNSLFEIVSAQGNVGLSVGIVNGEMPIGAKIITIFNMWIGRLEIIPVLVILRSFIEIFKGVIPKKTY